MKCSVMLELCYCILWNGIIKIQWQSVYGHCKMPTDPYLHLCLSRSYSVHPILFKGIQTLVRQTNQQSLIWKAQFDSYLAMICYYIINCMILLHHNIILLTTSLFVFSLRSQVQYDLSEIGMKPETIKNSRTSSTYSYYISACCHLKVLRSP